MLERSDVGRLWKTLLQCCRDPLVAHEMPGAPLRPSTVATLKAPFTQASAALGVSPAPAERTVSAQRQEIICRRVLASLFTVFLSQCPAPRDRRGTLAQSLPARTRESTPRLSPRLLTGAEVTRAEGPQSARLFTSGTDLDAILMCRF